MDCVKIFKNLYIVQIVEPDKNKKEEFLKLPQIDKIEILLDQKPSFKQFESNSVEDKSYTPSFGKYVISPYEKEFIRFYDLNFTKRKSEELFSKFNDEYLDMLSYYKELCGFIYSPHTL